MSAAVGEGSAYYFRKSKKQRYCPVSKIMYLTMTLTDLKIFNVFLNFFIITWEVEPWH